MRSTFRNDLSRFFDDAAVSLDQLLRSERWPSMLVSISLEVLEGSVDSSSSTACMEAKLYGASMKHGCTIASGWL